MVDIVFISLPGQTNDKIGNLFKIVNSVADKDRVVGFTKSFELVRICFCEHEVNTAKIMMVGFFI